MNWINPKIDWKTGATPGPGDFNRIEGNIFLPRMQVFLESGSFVSLDGIVDYWITMCGAGGGGNYNSGSAISFGGSGAAAYYRKKISVIQNETISITVGVGGGVGVTGGTSSFGAYLSCPGGGGSPGNGPVLPGGDGGEAGTPDHGGFSLFGVGARYSTNVNLRNVAGGYGSGGYGNVSPYCNGASGVVIVEW